VKYIAGHDFPDFGPCVCGVRWTIRNARHQDVGTTGIAHSGALTLHEYLQIETARLAEDARIASASLGAVGLGGAVAVEPDGTGAAAW
jgi:hypothetical protein